MNILRTCLLVLLAVLLPVRGGMAAAMLCPVGSSGMHHELRVHEPPAGREAMGHGMAHVHADHRHAHAGAGHHHDGQAHATSDTCNLCSACCSLTPPASELPALHEPVELAAIRFPDLSSPAPSFLSDGQERPPRSI